MAFGGVSERFLRVLASLYSSSKLDMERVHREPILSLQSWSIRHFIIWPVRPGAQFPWKTIREKVPYEGRTRRSDRAGKTRTALQEMRTALLETTTAKSMQVYVKNNFVAAKFWSLQNESWKLYTIEASPMQNYFSRQLSPKAKKEI